MVLTEYKKRVLLVSVYKGVEQKEICEEHLKELELLVKTYGADPIKKVPCGIRKYDAATFITEGKLQELIALSKEIGAEMVIFDDEITPAQQRNLEKAFSIPVIDRTAVILEVFAARAKTKEAKAQIELAKVKYEAPRLKRLWTHLSRQAGSGGGGSGGGGYLKGEGEKQIEIDRRLLKQKIDLLKREIEDVKAIRNMQRNARERSEIPVFAIIGYTNAGKSTLLNALTEADVFVEDKLFATLDTTTRKFTLSSHQEILLIDTVGFIRKLPHLLVAAFKSTLEEAIQADVLLHLIDVSHPMAEEQAATTFEVLKELNSEKKPIITVLNKIDKCENSGMIRRLRLKYPKTVEISALKRQGFDDLQEMIINELKAFRKFLKLKIPQSDYAVVTEIMRVGNILHQIYEENDVLLEVDVPEAVAGRVQKYLVEDFE
ncbi:MAG TPA: GTPase HflX [Parachlamydiaceae bacterium]|nr:GTPase HflX [Parachlamydiaceae bacterium]